MMLKTFGLKSLLGIRTCMVAVDIILELINFCCYIQWIVMIGITGGVSGCADKS